jgi:hypothetical protein
MYVNTPPNSFNTYVFVFGTGYPEYFSGKLAVEYKVGIYTYSFSIPTQKSNLEVHDKHSLCECLVPSLFVSKMK